MDCFRRRTDFPRCVEMTEILNVFGKNLSTVCTNTPVPYMLCHTFPFFFFFCPPFSNNIAGRRPTMEDPAQGHRNMLQRAEPRGRLVRKPVACPRHACLLVPAAVRDDVCR